MGSQKYFILLLMKTPRSIQTVHWQRRWVCWKIKICSFVYLSFKWVRLKTFWPPLVSFDKARECDDGQTGLPSHIQRFVGASHGAKITQRLKNCMYYSAVRSTCADCLRANANCAFLRIPKQSRPPTIQRPSLELIRVVRPLDMGDSNIAIGSVLPHLFGGRGQRSRFIVANRTYFWRPLARYGGLWNIAFYTFVGLLHVVLVWITITLTLT